MPYCSPPPGGDSSVCTLPLGNYYCACLSLYIIDFKHLCVVYVNVKLLPRDCYGFVGNPPNTNKN